MGIMKPLNRGESGNSELPASGSAVSGGRSGAAFSIWDIWGFICLCAFVWLTHPRYKYNMRDTPRAAWEIQVGPLPAAEQTHYPISATAAAAFVGANTQAGLALRTGAQAVSRSYLDRK